MTKSVGLRAKNYLIDDGKRERHKKACYKDKT